MAFIFKNNFNQELKDSFLKIINYKSIAFIFKNKFNKSLI